MKAKVKCPYCGATMKLNEVILNRRFFECPKCEARSPLTRTADDALEAAMKRVPASNGKPVVRGQWKCVEHPQALGNACSRYELYGRYECSVCSKPVAYKTTFCSNCGADMRPGKESTE